MKKLLFFAAMAMMVQYSFGQLAYNQNNLLHNGRVYSDVPVEAVQVPQPVKDAWQKDYSAVKGEKWYQTVSGFMACYEYKNFQSRVLYDGNGKVLMHSREVDSSNIPILILNFMNKKYPGMIIEKMFMNYPVTGQNVYEIKVGDNLERFDVNGNNLGDKTSDFRVLK